MDLDTWEDKQAKKRRAKDNGPNQDQVAFVTKLGAAKHALSLAQEMPDITELIDHAEAVRAAAKSLHISTEGINAWTRFVIDAERVAWTRIEKMREAGELTKTDQRKTERAGTDHKARKTGTNSGLVSLKDIIDHRPTQRASEWAALARLTEHQLNEAESVANAEDRLLTRHELIMLAKAGTPTETREKTRSTMELAFISGAIEEYAEDSDDGRRRIAVDPDDATVNQEETGAWVEAWVWVPDPLAESDYHED